MHCTYWKKLYPTQGDTSYLCTFHTLENGAHNMFSPWIFRPPVFLPPVRHHGIVEIVDLGNLTISKSSTPKNLICREKKILVADFCDTQYLVNYSWRLLVIINIVYTYCTLSLVSIQA